MDKRIINVGRMQLVLGLVCDSLNEAGIYNHIGTWFLTNAILCYFLRLLLVFHWEIEKIYPPEKLCAPAKYRRMFFKLFDKENVPKPMIVYIYLLGIIFVLTTLGEVILWSQSNDNYEFKILIINLTIVISTFVIMYYTVYINIFLERFKRINKYNIKYGLIFSYKRTCKWPNSKRLGVCNVVEHYEKKNKTYATVKMLDTGEVYQEVLAISEITSNSRKKYKLYEICNERYITL